MATQPAQDNAFYTTFSYPSLFSLASLPAFGEDLRSLETVGRKSGLDEEDELEDDDDLIDDEDDDVDDLEDDDEDDLDDEDDELEDDEDDDEEDDEDEEEDEEDEVKPLKVK